MPIGKSDSAKYVNTVIKELHSTTNAHFQNKLAKILPDDSGKLPSGVSVKESLAQLKGTILELSNVKDQLTAVMNTEQYKDLIGFEIQGHLPSKPSHDHYGVRDPAMQLELEVNRYDAMISSAQHGLSKLVSANPKEVAETSDIELSRQLNTPVFEPKLPTREKEKPRMDAHGDSTSWPTAQERGFSVQDRIKAWHASYDSVVPKEEKTIHFKETVQADMYIGARLAAKDISWQDGMTHIGSYQDDLNEGTTANEKTVGDRGAHRFNNPASPEFDPNVRLSYKIKSATKNYDKATVNLGVDDPGVQEASSPRATEKADLAKAVGPEKAARIVGKAQSIEAQDAYDETGWKKPYSKSDDEAIIAEILAKTKAHLEADSLAADGWEKVDGKDI